MFARSGLVRRAFRAVRSAAYLVRHGEEDMVDMYGRNPNGGDSEALRRGSSNIAAGISNPGGGL